jgi:hypothetical protein
LLIGQDSGLCIAKAPKRFTTIIFLNKRSY